MLQKSQTANHLPFGWCLQNPPWLLDFWTYSPWWFRKQRASNLPFGSQMKRFWRVQTSDPSAVFIQNFSHENQEAFNGLNGFWGDHSIKVTKCHPLFWLEVIQKKTVLRVTWTHHPKKVTSRIARLLLLLLFVFFVKKNEVFWEKNTLVKNSTWQLENPHF